MEPITGYCDLCISNWKDLKELTLMLREAVELEYKNVAIEQIFDHTDYDNKAKKTDPVPEPLDMSLFEEFKGKLRIFNRLTVIFTENAVQLVFNKSINLKKYHILAVIPTTDSALLCACQSINCDIISYNADTIRLRILRKHYFEACNRNIFFELKYAPCIVDSNERKDTITKGHKYHAQGKSRNIILSSGATDKFQLRSPYDVAHLGWIFGLSEEQSKNAICGTTRKLLICAETRRLGTSMVYVRKLKELGVNDPNEISDSDTDSSEDEIKKNPSTIDASNLDAEMLETPNKKQKLS